MPAAFAACAPVVIVAVYVVLYASGEDGVKVAVAPFVVTEPATAPLSLCSLKVSVVSVEPFIVREKVAETAVFIPTPVAPLDGLIEFTVKVTLVGGGSEEEDDVVNDTWLPVDVPLLWFAARR